MYCNGSIFNETDFTLFLNGPVRKKWNVQNLTSSLGPTVYSYHKRILSRIALQIGRVVGRSEKLERWWGGEKVVGLSLLEG